MPVDILILETLYGKQIGLSDLHQKISLTGIVTEAPAGEERSRYVFNYFFEGELHYKLLLPQKIRKVEMEKEFIFIDTEWVQGGGSYDRKKNRTFVKGVKQLFRDVVDVSEKSLVPARGYPRYL